MKYDLDYVLDSALDGIFIVAGVYRLVLFNRACEELFGLDRNQVVDRACWKLADFETTWKSERNRSGKGIAYGELAAKKERMVLPHKGGKEVWVETIYTPIYDPDRGNIAYVMGVIKDISEQKRLEEEKVRLLEQLDSMREDLERKYNFSGIVGRSPATLKALKLTAEVAPQNTTVLILGESGTGKELFARAIHYNSPRASGPFVALNCSAFPDTLIESELFGYERGAFTGADKARPGKVQRAAGGTLFLDEVTELSAPAQAKILRLIQEREFEPLGGLRALSADIRLIAATNKDIEKQVREGKFREDLYYRLCVYPVTLPPLRERPEDLPVLVDFLLEKFTREMGKGVKTVSPEALSVLASYRWPGNVRELQNVLERVTILSKREIVGISDLPAYLVRDASALPGEALTVPADNLPNSFSLEKTVQKFENKAIATALKNSGYNKAQAAKNLGLSRSTFRYKLAKVPREMLSHS